MSDTVIVQMGGRDFYGQRLDIAIPPEMIELLLQSKSIDSLQLILDTQIEKENFKGAVLIRNRIAELKNNPNE